jgi:2'-5' RNA ligase
MVSTLSKRLGVKREKVFIPHITSGRVKKDLYDEEYKNLSSQIAGLNNKHFNSDEISFIPQKLELIESDYTNYETLQEYQFSK